MSELLQKIRSRGYWQVIIRPTTFAERRIPDLSSLHPILERSSVQLRGWAFPHLEGPRRLRYGAHWIEQESEWRHRLSVWRFHQSGQFVHVSSMPTDWRDQWGLGPVDDDWEPGVQLGVGDALCTFLEVFEFAARLALSDAGDQRMYIDVTPTNLKRRALYMDTQRAWPFVEAYRASIERYQYQVELPTSHLVAAPGDAALEAARELFERFGWNRTVDQLREWRRRVGV